MGSVGLCFAPLLPGHLRSPAGSSSPWLSPKQAANECKSNRLYFVSVPSSAVPVLLPFYEDVALAMNTLGFSCTAQGQAGSGWANCDAAGAGLPGDRGAWMGGFWKLPCTLWKQVSIAISV